MMKMITGGLLLAALLSLTPRDSQAGCEWVQWTQWVWHATDPQQDRRGAWVGQEFYDSKTACIASLHQQHAPHESHKGRQDGIHDTMAFSTFMSDQPSSETTIWTVCLPVGLHPRDAYPGMRPTDDYAPRSRRHAGFPTRPVRAGRAGGAGLALAPHRPAREDIRVPQAGRGIVGPRYT